VEDSKNTIIYFVTGYSPKDDGLKVLVECIGISLKNVNAQLFHVYSKNNIEVDVMANRAIGLSPCLLGFFGEECFDTPP
jgi:hypothetical protein